MSLIIGIGSNIGEKLKNLEMACENLEEKFTLKAKSKIYKSSPVGYLNQPDFYNQVLEFKLPSCNPMEVMKYLLAIEKKMGRTPNPKANRPRIIDLDLLFFGMRQYQSSTLTIPHPRVFQRSFVVFPMQELPYYTKLQKKFIFPKKFNNQAFPLFPF